MVFQQYNLFPHRTVLENLVMAPVQVLAREPAEVRERAVRCWPRSGLTGKESAYPGELSGGQQQRVAIARALSPCSPASSCSTRSRPRSIPRWSARCSPLSALARDGMTCVLGTHEMRFAERSPMRSSSPTGASSSSTGRPQRCSRRLLTSA